MLTNIWRVLVILGLVIFLSDKLFEKDVLAPLFASAGIIGVAIGFGAQSLIKDFLSGIFIISENQFRVDGWEGANWGTGSYSVRKKWNSSK
jgi:small conductance mechanosensitive channel